MHCEHLANIKDTKSLSDILSVGKTLEMYLVYKHSAASKVKAKQGLTNKVVQKSENRSHFRLKLCQILNDLPNSFTVWKRKKQSNASHISPHLKYVAALLCEITDTFKYDYSLEENENKMYWFCMYRIQFI